MHPLNLLQHIKVIETPPYWIIGVSLDVNEGGRSYVRHVNTMTSSTGVKITYPSQEEADLAIIHLKSLFSAYYLPPERQTNA